ncbi:MULTISPECIES: hypothetical protein [Okeania]|nr:MULTISPECIES: hypothetical protein [Okeania]
MNLSDRYFCQFFSGQIKGDRLLLDFSRSKKEEGRRKKEGLKG